MPPPPRRPVTEWEAVALAALATCSFVPATPQKRFARQMRDATEITAKQAEWLRVLVHRYRRQIPRVCQCPTCSAGVAPRHSGTA